MSQQLFVTKLHVFILIDLFFQFIISQAFFCTGKGSRPHRATALVNLVGKCAGLISGTAHSPALP